MSWKDWLGASIIIVCLFTAPVPTLAILGVGWWWTHEEKKRQGNDKDTDHESVDDQ